MEREPTSGADAGAFWQRVIDNTLRFRSSHWNGDKAWRRYIDLYKGKHWKAGQSLTDNVDSESVRERITVNKTGSTVTNMLPFLIRKAPKYLVKPRRPEDVVSAMLQGETLNYVWREFKMQRHARRAILDDIVIGHGIVKTGFTLEVDEGRNPTRTSTLEYRPYIRKEEPFIRRISPFHFVWDIESPDNDLDSARWCAELIFKPVQDVLESEFYNPTVLRRIRTGDETPSTVKSFLKNRNDERPWDDIESDNLDRIVLIELWDKRSGKYFVFAHGIDEPLREENEWPYNYLEGFPYEMVSFIPLIDEPYPLGLPAFIEDQQYELNRVRTAMFQHRRRFNRKYWALEDVDAGELSKLANGEDGTIIRVKHPQSVGAIEDANISSDEYNIEAVINQDIRELTGADELLRGGQLPSRTTATEVGVRTQLIGLKIEDRVEQVDDFINSIGYKILQHVKHNYVTDKVVQITGPKGTFWVDFTPEDIQGEFDIDIESTSAKRTNPDIERQQAIQIMQMLTQALPILQQAGVQINIGELFKWVLGKFENMKDVQLFFPQSGVSNAPLSTSVQEGIQLASPPASAQPSLPSVGGDSGTLGATAGAGGVTSDLLGSVLGSLSGG